VLSVAISFAMPRVLNDHETKKLMAKESGELLHVAGWLTKLLRVRFKTPLFR
jgi:hypothetical protein